MSADKKKSSYQLELERKSNDLLRVHNPTDARLVVEWDKKNGAKMFPVGPKQDAVFVRYIAKKYVKECFFNAVMQKSKESIEKENERRRNAGMAEMDRTLKTGEQEQFEKQFYGITDADIELIMDYLELAWEQGKTIDVDNSNLTNLQKEAVKIVSLLYLGVESEYGVDREAPVSGTVDFKDVLTSAMVNQTSQETEAFKCDYPGCSFETKHRLALSGHQKTHNKDINNKKAEAVSSISK